MKPLFIFLLFITFQANSQTIINYQTWTGASGCNIFSSATNVPATVNGSNVTLSHLSTVGQPTYDAVNHAVNLDGNIQNGSIYLGTEYLISYNFQQGYSYTISINAVSINNSGGFPNLRLKITNSTGTSTSCSGPQSIDNSLSGNLTFSQAISNGNFGDYSYNIGTMANSNSYLTLANVPNLAGGYQYLLIRKITITAQAPAASFSISPASVPIICGTNTPVTFLVNNNSGTTGITDYVWNLGGTNNGWLFNGNAAPQTISTGTSNTLTLTPVCGVTQTNISATVTANGNNYTTNTSVVTNTLPSMSISGSAALCAQNSYSISNLPCNASVNWSVNPTGIASLSCNSCLTPVVTRLTDGAFGLMATVTACGKTQELTGLAVQSGSGFSGYYFIGETYNALVPETSGSNYLPANNWYVIHASSSVSASPQWTYVGGYANSWYMYFNELRVNLQSEGYAAFQMDINTSCGTMSETYIFETGSSLRYYTVAPNPATSEVTFSVDEQKIKQAKSDQSASYVIQKIIIMDQTGNTVIQKSYPSQTKRATVNVSLLRPDIYIAKIFDGKQWTTVKLVKK